MKKILILLWILIVVSSCKKNQINYIPLKENEVATLPIIFHVIHRGENIGVNDNISGQKIQQYLNALNANFRNYSFNGNSVDIKIQFRLAQYDNYGNYLQESGIHRIYAPNYQYIYNNSQNQVLYDNYWNPKEYINIWVGDTYSNNQVNTTSWTSSLPVCTYSHTIPGLYAISENYANSYIPMYPDGIVLANILFYNDNIGYAITHELGHYLGLYHVFDDENCSDDYVYDTYHYNRSYYDINASNNLYRWTCNNYWTLADNYMDYQYQSEYKFTYGQMARMREVLSYSPQRTTVRFSNKRTTYSTVPSRDTLGIYPNPTNIQ